MRGYHFSNSIKEREAMDDQWSQRTMAEVAGSAVKHPVPAKELQDDLVAQSCSRCF